MCRHDRVILPADDVFDEMMEHFLEAILSLVSFTNTWISCSLPSSPASQPGKIASVLKKAIPVAAHENIYTIPNLLTASRLVLAPVIGYCILHDYHAWTLGLFAYAGITDLLDGWIARKWNQGTVVGTIIDPMADKTLMTVLTVALAIKGGLPG
jgi:cardiolipin synthase